MLVDFFNPPVRLKYKKFQKKSTYNNKIQRSLINTTLFGAVSVLKSLTHGRLSINQLESARKVIRRKIKKLGLLRAFVYPSVSITKKALAVRMGKGKGAVDSWVFPVRPGSVIFEISLAPVGLGFEALVMASKKLPIRSKVFMFK